MGLFCVGLWRNTDTNHSCQPSHTAIRELGAAVAEHQFLCNQCEGKGREETGQSGLGLGTLVLI